MFLAQSYYPILLKHNHNHYKLRFLKQKRARDGIIKKILEKYDWEGEKDVIHYREGIIIKRKGKREREKD